MSREFPIVLITGAGSGIGLALTKRLLRGEFRVVATARDLECKERLNSLVGNENLLVKELDINKSEDRVRVVGEVVSEWGEIDVLVNNAGISYRSVIEHMSEEEELGQLRTNFIGPMELIKLVLPAMRRRRSGRIINVSSVGGMMAMPTMGSYSASKFALEGATEALWYEMRPWNVKVSLVQPGFINSASFKRVYSSERSQSSSGYLNYEAYYRGMESFVEKLMRSAFATSDSVAGVIEKAILSKNPSLRIPATIDAYLFGVIRRILPRAVYHQILYRMLPGVRSWGKDK